MKPLPNILFALLTVLAVMLLSGCATRMPTPAQYDFGPLRALPMEAPPSTSLPPLRIADTTAPAWLDTTLMHFRLAYANDQQMRPYADSRWSMPPAKLFGQRLKARMAESGAVVMNATDGGSAIPLVRVEMDDFTQIFDSTTHSWVRISVRVSVFRNRALLAQRTFVRDWPAPTANAAGGARALADASDATIGDLLLWLATQPIKR